MDRFLIGSMAEIVAIQAEIAAMQARNATCLAKHSTPVYNEQVFEEKAALLWGIANYVSRYGGNNA